MITQNYLVLYLTVVGSEDMEFGDYSFHTGLYKNKDRKRHTRGEPLYTVLAWAHDETSQLSVCPYSK